MMRQLVGGFVQLAIGKLLVIETDSRAIRRTTRLGFEKLVQALVRGIVGYGLVPSDQQLLTLAVVQQRQAADECVRSGNGGAQESLKVSCKLFDRMAIEAGRVVVKLEP